MSKEKKKILDSDTNTGSNKLVDSTVRILKNSQIVNYKEILVQVNKKIYHLTGHKLTQLESPEYKQRHINYTDAHRIEIVKALADTDGRRIVNLSTIHTITQQ